MNTIGRLGLSAVLLATAATFASAQEMNPTATAPAPNTPTGPSEMQDGVPVYKIQVVAREIPAINYFHRQGSTKIGFEGTELLPGASTNVRAAS